MRGWKEVKLGEVTELFYGKSLVARKRIKGDVPVFSSAGITGYHNEPLIDSKGIIIGRKGTIGTVYKSETPFYCIDTAYYILPNDDKYNFNYMYYLLQTLGLTNLNSDSAVPGLNRNTAYDQTFLFPPLPEQKAIAEVLSSLDDKIDLLHRQNKTLEQMAETLFRQWFVEEADEGWEEKEIGELFNLLGGYSFKSKDYIDNGKYKVITIKSVQDGYFDVSSASSIEIIPEKLKPHQILNIGDILLSLTGNVGRICIVDKENCLLNQRVAKIEPKRKELQPFAYFYFRQPEMIEKLTYLAKGSAQLNLSPIETLKQTELLPDLSTIIEFNELVTDYFHKLITNKLQIHTLKNLRDTLLPKLMNGDVRVQI